MEANIKLNPYIETMPLSSFPVSLLKELKLLSFSGKKTDKPLSRKDIPRSNLIEIFGSANYRFQKYGADVDGIQDFTGDGTFESFISSFQRKLQKIVKNIINTKTHYITEIKAGIDVRYNIDIGELRDGVYYINDDLYIISKKMYEEGLFDDIEFTRIELICKIRNRDLNSDDYDIIYNTFRERLILRWSGEEILKGYKQVSANRYIALKDALKLSTPTKIDMIAYYDGKFIEITNFIILAFEVNGKYYTINKKFPIVKSELYSFQDTGLEKEIEKLLYSNYHYSPFKAAKRLYALARLRHDNNMLRIVIPFVGGNISLLYQIKSEIDSDIVLLNITKTPPMASINKHIDSIKLRLAKVLEIEREEIIRLNELIDDAYKETNKMKKMEKLLLISYNFKKIINKHTIEFFDATGLNPMKRNYMPNKLMYLVRHIPVNYIDQNPILKIDTYIMETKDIEIKKSKKIDKKLLKRINVPSNDDIINDITKR